MKVNSTVINAVLFSDDMNIIIIFVSIICCANPDVVQ